ncbi:MAG: vWA domain-containing protein [Paracoccaceae bacterium]
MSDELNKLQAAMRATSPKPDASSRAKNLALAQKNFEPHQGMRAGARPTSDRRSFGRLLSGVATMFQSISTRGALAASTAIVAFGLVVILPQGRDILVPPSVFPDGSAVNIPDLMDEIVVDQDRRERSDDVVAQAAEPMLGTTESNEFAAASQLTESKSDRGLSLSRIQNKEMDAVATLVAPSSAPLPKRESIVLEEPDTEVFSNAPAASLKITSQDPVSTFSIDVDTASYAVVRSSLMAGFLPPVDAVRIEEMINYFPYDYAAPAAGDAPFSQNVSVMETPWNPETQLVHIALQGRMPALEDRPPLNLVFLIDTSGSMQAPNKLPLLKQSFRLMLGQLRPSDQVAIVTYAGSVGQVLEPTAASERSTILAALENLHAGGSTAGQAGLQQAYAVAEAMAEDNEVTRIILATDGDFNVGISDPDALIDFIATKRDTGTYLSVLGFGRGNLDDATMQALAQNGNGIAAYIDTLNEAQKVLVDQLSGALFPIAGDVKVQVEFNPAVVAEYRLIGYETRALAREDFNNDKVDAGDIGAGHSVTAIYEITPVGSDAVLNDPLRYGGTPAISDPSDELGFLRLRYKNPGETKSHLIETPIPNYNVELDDEIDRLGTDADFAVAIAGFGQLLRGSDYLGDWSWQNAIDLANGALGPDPFGYRREAVSLMRLAQSLSDQ